MRIVAVIQARMGSERLPGKVLRPLGGKSVLEHVVDRVRFSGAFDEIVVATTDHARDDVLVEEAAGLGVVVVRGSEADVLSRFILAITTVPTDALARITADCPLIAPDVLAAMADRFRAEKPDYLSNALKRTYPRGLDAEFLTVEALRVADAEGHADRHREHVTPFVYEHPERFRIVDFVDAEDRSNWRWTLDTAEDYELLGRLVDAVDDEYAPYPVLARVYAGHPDWDTINAHIEQKKVS